MDKSNYEHMLSPFNIGNLTVKNRFCLAPMGFLPSAPDSVYTNEATEYFVERAKGGYGLLTVGAIWTDTHVDVIPQQAVNCPLTNPTAWVKQGYFMNDRIHAYGAKVFAQLATGNGRNASTMKSPSPAIAFNDPSVMCQELTVDDLKRKLEDYKKAAALVKNANYDGIEVHALHWGYLLDQFALSIVNKRTDEYGGCLENRLRFVMQLREAIKEVCGADYPVSIRMGLKSYLKGLGGRNSHMGSLYGEDEVGRTVEEATEIVKLLESFGYNAISANAGVYESFYHACPPSYIPDGPVIDLAAYVKTNSGVKIPIMCGTRMDDFDMCEKAVVDGKIDAAVIGRPSLADPCIPKKLEMGQKESIRPCITCNQACIGLGMAKGFASCAVNPAVRREAIYDLSKTEVSKKVIVIGGGVGGMETARVAATRGHKVTLYEATDRIGGNLITASQHAFKKNMAKLNTWYQRELGLLNVDIHLNTRVTPEDVIKEKPDAVVLAVGGTAIMPKISGHHKAVSCVDALLGKKEVGQKVVIVGGGMVGCELAYEYVLEKKDVTIVDAMDDILSVGSGDPIPIMNDMMLRDLFIYHKVNICTGHKIEAVTDDSAVVSSVADGSETTIEADTVVMAVGFRSAPSIADDLRGNGFPVYEIKHPAGIGNVKDSVWAAYEIARGL